MLNAFLFSQKLFLKIFLSPKLTLFPLILIFGEKKCKKFFYNNLKCLMNDVIFYGGLNNILAL